jgi:hypothetical protein
MGVYSENQMNTQTHSVGIMQNFFNVKASGTYSNHCAFKGYDNCQQE